MKNQSLITQITHLSSVLHLIEERHNVEPIMTNDSTEGIVRTSAGVKHDKEESLSVYIPASGDYLDYSCNVSPMTTENVNMLSCYIKQKYLDL